MERSQQEMFMLIIIIAMYFQNHKLRVNIRITLPTQSVVTLAPTTKRSGRALILYHLQTKISICLPEPSVAVPIICAK